MYVTKNVNGSVVLFEKSSPDVQIGVIVKVTILSSKEAVDVDVAPGGLFSLTTVNCDLPATVEMIEKHLANPTNPTHYWGSRLA